VVAEILDAGLLGEGILLSLSSARKQGLIRHDATIIPQGATVYAQVVDSVAYQKFPVEMVSGFNLSAFNLFFVANEDSYEIGSLKSLEYVPVSGMQLQMFVRNTCEEIEEVFEFDFAKEQLDLQRSQDVQFKVKTKGSYSHLLMVFWFKLHLDANNDIDSSPDGTSHWGQAFQVASHSVPP
jgi:hypothetical protein